MRLQNKTYEMYNKTINDCLQQKKTALMLFSNKELIPMASYNFRKFLEAKNIDYTTDNSKNVIKLTNGSEITFAHTEKLKGVNISEFVVDEI